MQIDNLDDKTSQVRPLKVVIVGAGIGGLTAAIAMRIAGHIIYESSRFALETGAAIHLPSNANGILHRIGINPDEHGAVTCEWVSEYRPSGERVFLRDVTGLKNVYPYPWQLCHRIDLHNALKERALSEGVEIFLQSKVTGLDIAKSEITLIDGKKVTADLIIGADGTHSSLRKYIAGPDSASKLSGTSAFRFLIPADAVKSDPQTSHFCERNGELRLMYGDSHRIVMYPCRNNTELNFVCLHPDEESEGKDDDWNQSASKDLVLKIFDEYPADVKALLAKVQPETIKLWKLLDLAALTNWTEGNFALLGDAAHPFLPHQGQGGAQAIEDGAALGALFPLGTLLEDVEDRLKLYMEARYERATAIQQYTRDSAFKTKRGDHGGKVMDPMQFTAYNFSHDAFDHASGILERYLTSRALSPGYTRDLDCLVG
ncbi:hypothetical protein OIDMADRAFT_150275 [Oidiodendron maius Zn]|uniref:FAD-binding domain-containing protein n=1 Tax=Oidiodendron maius (strain Zn) TaxID=913774 RepID=A0A0C3I489_OIDMZ|nr:hypothetical protein OIDMADRAFT_150275 [Oidiodendron maius Zn]